MKFLSSSLSNKHFLYSLYIATLFVSSLISCCFSTPCRMEQKRMTKNPYKVIAYFAESLHTNNYPENQSDFIYHDQISSLHHSIHPFFFQDSQCPLGCRFLCQQLRRENLLFVFCQITSVFSATGPAHVFNHCFMNQNLSVIEYHRILQHHLQEGDLQFTSNNYASLQQQLNLNNLIQWPQTLPFISALFLNHELAFFEKILTHPAWDRLKTISSKTCIQDYDDKIKDEIVVSLADKMPNVLQSIIISYVQFSMISKTKTAHRISMRNATSSLCCLVS